MSQLTGQSTSQLAGQFTGKIALVTGASKGIGAEVARQLGAAGAAVVVNYASDRAGAERVVDAIKTAGGRAVAVQADVGKPAEVKRLFADADKAFGGKLDVLVNNAGIYQFAPLAEVTPEHFRKQFDVNVLGLILASQEAAKRFGDAGGSIVNVSSLVSIKGFPASAVYSATKGAVDAVTRVLSAELGPRKIRVNSVNPGVVITEGFQSAGYEGSDLEKEYIRTTALGRVAAPADIAQVVLFLAGPASGWLTGESLFATGGVR
jgi:3-oxoacyl-[acyl-carrier protein] reductase